VSETLTYIEQIKKLRDDYRADKDAYDKAYKILRDATNEKKEKFEKAVTKLVYDNTIVFNLCTHITKDSDTRHCRECKRDVYIVKAGDELKFMSWQDQEFIERIVKHYTECVND
jgi:hypothetical protein